MLHATKVTNIEEKDYQLFVWHVSIGTFQLLKISFEKRSIGNSVPALIHCADMNALFYMQKPKARF